MALGGEPTPTGTAVVDVFVIRRGWHTDLGFAMGTLQGALTHVGDRFPEARFVAFGFGDRRYLQSAHRGPATLLQALWPGAAVILVTALNDTPEAAFGTAHVRRLEIPTARSLEIQGFIARSLAESANGPSWISAGPYAGSAYAVATPRYSGIYTCNTWTADALRAGHLPIHVAGTLFAGQLWSQVAHLSP